MIVDEQSRRREPKIPARTISHLASLRQALDHLATVCYHQRSSNMLRMGVIGHTTEVDQAQTPRAATVRLTPAINTTGTFGMTGSIRRASANRLIHQALRSRNGAHQNFPNTPGVARRRVKSRRVSITIGHLPSQAAKCLLPRVLLTATLARNNPQAAETHGVRHSIATRSTPAKMSLECVPILVEEGLCQSGNPSFWLLLQNHEEQIDGNPGDKHHCLRHGYPRAPFPALLVLAVQLSQENQCLLVLRIAPGDPRLVPPRQRDLLAQPGTQCQPQDRRQQ